MRMLPLVGNSGCSVVGPGLDEGVGSFAGLAESCVFAGEFFLAAGSGLFVWAVAEREPSDVNPIAKTHSDRIAAPVSQRDDWAPCRSAIPKMRRKRAANRPPVAAGAMLDARAPATIAKART